MRRFLINALVLCLVCLGPASAAKKRPTSAKGKSPAHAAVKQKAPRPAAATVARRGGKTSRVAVKTVKGKRGVRVVRTSAGRSAMPAAPPRAARQASPTADRYREIQQALATKGYFQGTPDGVWNGDSISALRRFQQDQGLKPDGKLDSLSLMALGLGPPKQEKTTGEVQVVQ